MRAVLASIAAAVARTAEPFVVDRHRRCTAAVESFVNRRRSTMQSWGGNPTGEIMHRIHYATLALLALSAGCVSSEPRATARDSRGNYATTSEFNSMQRSEFMAAMRAGLDDFDRRRAELEARASRLGQKAVEELHDHLPGLVKRRTDFVNELARLDATLDKDWPDRRRDTEEAYRDLRAALDEAYDEVLKA